MPPLISVIIPTLNEEQNIAAVIDATRGAGDCEIVVVDGGSTDQTVNFAQDADLVISRTDGKVLLITGAPIVSEVFEISP